MMVRRLLPGATLQRADAADALAVAICHAHHRASRAAPGRRAAVHGMIALLTGTVDALEPTAAASSMSHGVGYLVQASHPHARPPCRATPATARC